MEILGWELLKSVGRFFTHPLTYILPLVMFMLGYFRVKRERADFHMKVQQAVFDVTAPILPGLLAGIVLSVITVILAPVISVIFLFLIGILTLLFSITGRANLLSPALTLGVSILIVYFITVTGAEVPWISSQITGLGQGDILAVMTVMTVLLFGEAILVWKDGPRHTSPLISKSPRGKWVGAHRLQRVWFVPLFLFIPGGPLEGFSVWPIVPFEDGGLSLFLVPVAIGSRFTIYHTLPQQAFTRIGQYICMLAIIVGAGTILAYFYPGILLYVTIFAVAGRLFLQLFVKRQERGNPPLFTLQRKGVKILGVLPSSPAEKMGLLPGETIIKVNGLPVNNEREFYHALQKNSAYSKVEVRDMNGEVRHTQSTVYDNEHHEIGVLLVKEKDYPFTMSREG
ncbi:PDZ domain-containing protein [Alteribacillus iranensis]|uniref:PDZ domain-containing protein n=1 Tax=Alteribacillus iranensis TaxID=930128 RepID=A0A1I2EK90_9BACI|nr:PDZ domain-containing protein [Alteribacillus iranensis]SFE93285.1 PDZ domain-containing protein [Alteribacillus iranensis]